MFERDQEENRSPKAVRRLADERAIPHIRLDRRLRNAVGATGPISPDTHLNTIAAIHDNIDHIHHELDVQLKRMAQLQVEVDEARATLKRLIDESNA